MKYMTILYLPKVSLEKSSTTVIADEATTTMVKLLSHISSLTRSVSISKILFSNRNTNKQHPLSLLMKKLLLHRPMKHHTRKKVFKQFLSTLRFSFSICNAKALADFTVRKLYQSSFSRHVYREVRVVGWWQRANDAFN